MYPDLHRLDINLLRFERTSRQFSYPVNSRTIDLRSVDRANQKINPANERVSSRKFMARTINIPPGFFAVYDAYIRRST